MGKVSDIGRIEREIRTTDWRIALRIALTVLFGAVLATIGWIEFGGGPAFLVAIGGAVAWVGWELIRIARRHRFSLALGSRGFEFQCDNDDPQGCAWDDIVEIHRKFTWVPAGRYSTVLDGTFGILTAEGRHVEFGSTDFEDTSLGVVAFAGAVESYVHDRMMWQALAAWEAGVDIPFGKLSVGPAGVGEAGSPIPWNELAVARFETCAQTLEQPEHKVTLRRDGNMLLAKTVSSGDIPNWKLFQALVEHGRKLHPRDYAAELGLP